MTETRHPVAAAPQGNRKPYHAPVVRTYGNIQEITQSSANGNGHDNGGPKPHKTGV
jgi:hypothetical protein